MIFFLHDDYFQSHLQLRAIKTDSMSVEYYAEHTFWVSFQPRQSLNILRGVK